MRWISGFLAVVRWIYRRGKAMYVHIWLAIPLFSGCYFLLNNRSEWTDIHAVAISAPTFWREGVITKVGPRGRSLEFKMKDGSVRGISCEMTDYTTSACIHSDRHISVNAKVELFDYRNRWMILSVIDKDKNELIVSKQKQINSYKLQQDYNKSLTNRNKFLTGFSVGISIVIMFAISSAFMFILIKIFAIFEKRKRVKN